MEAIEDILELKLQGGGVIPQTLKAKELAKLAESLENALLHLVSRDNPEINKEHIFISLVEIKDQSAGLRFSPYLRDLLVAGFLTIASSIRTGDFENLPINTIKSLKPILQFAKKRNCNAEFRVNDNTYAVIHPDTAIEIPQSAYITGFTTIYPTVKRAGGVNPTIALLLPQSVDFLFVETSEEIAKKLGERLYTVVGLSGFAKWERESLKLVDFRIDKILDYQKASIRQSFERVGEVLGKHFDRHDDVSEIFFRDKFPEEE